VSSSAAWSVVELDLVEVRFSSPPPDQVGRRERTRMAFLLAFSAGMLLAWMLRHGPW